MPKAARLTDPCIHGGAVTGPGCATVLTSKLKAARVGDQHMCPAHVGGPIVQGSQSVKIGGQFASRVLDQALCAGPTDAISKGARTVIIGGPTLTFHASGHGGNTLVAVDPMTKTVYIESFLEYSGPDATQAYADHAEQEIESTWAGTMQRGADTYQVQVNVNASVNTSGTPTPGYDPIVVDASTSRMNQSMYGNGPGLQTPAAANPSRRRIAHEYGHTLGLSDEYHDTPTGSAPNDPSKLNNIMAETWPDSTGTMPHPHQDHYDHILTDYGW